MSAPVSVLLSSITSFTELKNLKDKILNPHKYKPHAYNMAGQGRHAGAIINLVIKEELKSYEFLRFD